MVDAHRFLIDGRWESPLSGSERPLVDPSSEDEIGRVALGGEADVDRAVAAARRAFPAWSRTAPEERLALLRRAVDIYKRRSEDMARAIMTEMGAPWRLASTAQAGSGLMHLATMARILEHFCWEERLGQTRVLREPMGVCALITPWNWPANQVAAKVAPALAAGCAMVLKPSEIAPLDAAVFAEILVEAGVPPGVFNLVQGEGPVAGTALSRHPDVDLVSFTGSSRGGIAVATDAAPTVKRVTQELGGKSPNILLEDADFPRAVKGGVLGCMHNTGQSCNAPTRLLVPAARLPEVEELAVAAVARIRVGDPRDESTTMGPQASRAQWEKVQELIAAGRDEGARLLCGGPGRPEGLERGFYSRPTIFSAVHNTMRIAREEIFGPVLSILPYESEAQAIELANDTPYGLAAYVSSGDPERARDVARALRAGTVHLNGADLDPRAPFGGYRQSGNGREWGRWGLEEYLETKSIFGYGED